MSRFSVRQSSLKAWRQCRRKSYYKLSEHLRPKKISRPLKFGSLIHNLAEAKINGITPKKYLANLKPEEVEGFEDREEYGNILDDASDIMIEYNRKWKSDGLRWCKGPTGKKAEHKFTVELTKGIDLKGMIDAVARTEDRRRWLVEHKTMKQEWTDRDRWMNVQSSLYIPAWERVTGKRIDGVLWDYIYSKPPSLPKLNKDGSISKAAIVTLPVTVNRFLAASDLNSKTPGADVLIERGEEGVERYFQRIFNPRIKRVEKMVWDDAVETAKEMKRLLGSSRERTIDKHCNYCEFAKICQAALTGGDVKFVKKAFYYVDEEAAREEDENEDEVVAA